MKSSHQMQRVSMNIIDKYNDNSSKGFINADLSSNYTKRLNRSNSKKSPRGFAQRSLLATQPSHHSSIQQSARVPVKKQQYTSTMQDYQMKSMQIYARSRNQNMHKTTNTQFDIFPKHDYQTLSS
jgi:hypothetical protein